ncbi:MAG: histidine--tRNA ligase [Chloroflexi bacterium]|nr:histidine--tRNA ligase [Chloroflexota bacterium]
MAEYTAPRGTYDIMPDDQPYWRHVASVAHSTTALFGYRQIEPPIFEAASLFTRGIREGTDIVDKEMYIFKDRGDDLLSLRPEYTAGVVRAYIEHGMHTWPQPVKLYSLGPAFRYERPQAGRFRQLFQFNVEAIGSPDPAADFEVMSVAWNLYETIGLKGLSFQINSIGDRQCRPQFVKTLQAYYREHFDTICDDCKRRVDTNPLRVLDCKNAQCQPIIEGAPRTIDSLCEACASHFARLRQYLEQAQRPYTVNNRLVRGLDYYTRTVFEVWANTLGAQSAVCGGGRYDDLAEVLGGRPTAGVGFAAGVDRIVMAMRAEEIEPPALPSPQVLVAYQSEAAKPVAVQLAMRLRQAAVRAVVPLDSRSLKAQLKQADREGVRFALILGDEEIAGRTVVVKPMDGGDQTTVEMDTVVGRVVGLLGS